MCGTILLALLSTIVMPFPVETEQIRTWIHNCEVIWVNWNRANATNRYNVKLIQTHLTWSDTVDERWVLLINYWMVFTGVFCSNASHLHPQPIKVIVIQFQLCLSVFAASLHCQRFFNGISERRRYGDNVDGKMNGSRGHWWCCKIDHAHMLFISLCKS